MKLLITILAALGLASGGIGYANVSVTEFSKIIKQKDVQILDVRTPEEYAAQILAKEGFTLYNLETGIIGWTKDGKTLSC